MPPRPLGAAPTSCKFCNPRPGSSNLALPAMPDRDDDLPFGLYERLVTASLRARLLRFEPASTRVVTKELDPADAHATLARHVEELVAHALKDIPEKDRIARQTDLANQLIGLIDTGAADDLVESPPEQLRSIQAITGALADDRPIVAPLVPLSASDLLINARNEPGLGHSLKHEIPSADSIELLCAFVRWHGLRLLEDQLIAHCRAGRRLRVITTVFTGSTERKALDWLVKIGASATSA